MTLYLGARRLVAFVPPAVRSSLNSGITISNPGPGGGTTDAVGVGFRAAPVPIDDVETGVVRTGYIIITPDSGSAAPISTLTFGMVRDAIVQSQAGILPTPLTTSSAISVDVVQAAGRNVGVAIANPSATAALITLTLRDPDGRPAASAVSITIPPRSQMARFISEIVPAIGPAFRGSVGIQSSILVSIVGLRFSGVEFSTVPIPITDSAGVPQQGNVGGSNAVMFPQFAMSGGWATTLGLLNSDSRPISGRIDVFDATGNPMTIKLNDETKSTFTYSIPAGGSMLFSPRDTNGQSPF